MPKQQRRDSKRESSEMSSDVTSSANAGAGDQLPPPPSDDAATAAATMMEKDEADEKIPQLPKPVCAPAEVAKMLGTKQMENLFIDMSFYARLGFLQPPSCLKCAYRDAHQGTDYRDAIAAEGCGRLVLWRKDTALPIHPENMQTNSVVVTCQTAKAFMRGERVANLTWDKDNQKLVTN